MWSVSRDARNGIFGIITAHAVDKQTSRLEQTKWAPCVRWLHRLHLGSNRSLLGCIDFSVEAFWLTRIALFHLRAQSMTLREGGLSN